MSQIGLYWYSVYHIFISIPLSLNLRQTNEGVEYENKVELLFHDTCTPIMGQCAISFLFWFLFCFFLYEAIDILNGSDRFASFVFSWMVFFVFRKRKKNHSFHILLIYKIVLKWLSFFISWMTIDGWRVLFLLISLYEYVPRYDLMVSFLKLHTASP